MHKGFQNQLSSLLMKFSKSIFRGRNGVWVENTMAGGKKLEGCPSLEHGASQMCRTAERVYGSKLLSIEGGFTCLALDLSSPPAKALSSFQ